ncbi:hypothetical protein BLA29_012743 [Euroglyphus maynei]|uniref:Uncharacterized protein n=1 Tax=Euroglyphus maynei TaxID=6958 RepID=A0A1Y3BM01_EURMA|nr:hypothetical protein BLA29_012743 [Euroglyphus maynei]
MDKSNSSSDKKRITTGDERQQQPPSPRRRRGMGQKCPPKHHTKFIFKISKTIKEEAAKQCDYLQKKLFIKSAPDQVTMMVAIPNNNHNNDDDQQQQQHDNPDCNQ